MVWMVFSFRYSKRENRFVGYCCCNSSIRSRPAAVIVNVARKRIENKIKLVTVGRQVLLRIAKKIGLEERKEKEKERKVRKRRERSF